MKLSTKTFTILATSLLVAATALANNYRVDTTHSEIAFKVSHLGISTMTGYFNDFSTSFDLDPETKSVDTHVEDRDRHLKSADFFDVESYPEIRFTSKRAEVVSKNKVKLHEDLSIRGVTKPVVLDVEFKGAATGPMGYQRAAFVASTTINRKDFGVSWNKTLDTGGFVGGEDVRIQLELEAISIENTDSRMYLSPQTAPNSPKREEKVSRGRHASAVG